MGVLLTILVVAVGIALRGRLSWRRANLVDSTATRSWGVPWLMDTCARSFILVVLSVAGLLALGVMYGNVLGGG